MSVEIFFSYAHEDENLLKKLQTHLVPLQKEHLIDAWYDRDMSTGTEWAQKIDEHVNTAHIILLLVSQYSLNSDYFYSIETRRAIERHKRGEAWVIPVILRPVYYQRMPFAELRAFPISAKPVVTWLNLDDAFLNIADGIRTIANERVRNSKVPRKNEAQWLCESDNFYKIKRYVEALAACNEAEALVLNAEENQRAEERKVEIGPKKGTKLSPLEIHEEAFATRNEAGALSHHAEESKVAENSKVEIWQRKGRILRALKRYEEALAVFENILVLNSTDAGVWYDKGTVLRTLKRYQEAVNAFECAEFLAPDITDARYNKEITLQMLKSSENIPVTLSDTEKHWVGNQQQVLGRVIGSHATVYINSHDLVSHSALLPGYFSLFQRLVAWLNISMNAMRKGRRFLDTNQALLLVETEKELERLITARVEDRLEMTQQMQHHQLLLRDARRRGGTPAAIQEAYVNMYGGLAALDLPPWLESIEKERTFLNQFRRPERTVRARMNLLCEALSRAAHDANIAPEIIAELQVELGNLLAHSPHQDTFKSRLETLKRATLSYEESLKIYTFERYPWQYAKVCLALGDVYLQYGIATGQTDMVEQAISYYNATFWVYNRDEFPEQWAMLQTSLGKAYAMRSSGDPEESTAYAMTYHQSALQLATNANFPLVWAKVQINLGDLYQQSTAGGRLTNLKWARGCYQAAFQVYERATFPKEWADLHARLASLFQHYAEEDVKKQEVHQRCALVCYECALEIYTPDAFPVEYATASVNLGNLYRNRCSGEPSANYAQARQCYRDALRIFTSQGFPVEYSRVRHALTETEILCSKGSTMKEPDSSVP